MRVCFFGIYNSNYSRNRVLMRGFKMNGYDIVECKVDPKKNSKIKKFWNLYKEYKKIKGKFDYVIVAYPGHSVVWLARLLFGKDIIFDAFLSIYNSNVLDRKLYSLFSIRGVKDYFLDWYSIRLSKIVLLDTNEHIKYFSKTFHINKDKFVRVFVGSDNSIMYPEKRRFSNNNFIVEFHGSYIPLQGIDVIVKAAKILEIDKSIIFNLIGGGQEYGRIKKMINDLGVKNINLINTCPQDIIRNYINDADVCLGIFGEGIKTGIVIPNKVFEAIACKKTVISAKTSAIVELFNDKEDIILSNINDEEDLASKILLLKNNKSLLSRISNGGFDLYSKRLRPELLARDLLIELA